MAFCHQCGVAIAENEDPCHACGEYQAVLSSAPAEAFTPEIGSDPLANDEPADHVSEPDEFLPSDIPQVNIVENAPLDTGEHAPVDVGEPADDISAPAEKDPNTSEASNGETSTAIAG